MIHDIMRPANGNVVAVCATMILISGMLMASNAIKERNFSLKKRLKNGDEYALDCSLALQ